MSHIKPQRWNDAFTGRVSDAERARMDRHADACSRCATARDRVTSASGTFGALRTQAAPELPWDSIRARVHWSVSSERRASQRGQQPPNRARLWQGLALGLASAAAVTLGIITLADRAPSTEVARSTPTAPVQPTAPAAVTPAAPAALVGLVNRAAGDIMIAGIRTSDVFGRRIVAGDVIATGEGRLDVQFGTASAFQLAPRSTLEVRRFDATMIELVIDGTVDVQVAARASGQRFVIHAGTRDIEVRGTQFRVAHDRTSTTVACRHGLVAVRDARGELEVAGERALVIPADRAVTDERVAMLTRDELVSLASTTPYALPLWTDAAALASSSAPLEVTTRGRQNVDVRVDGIEHGIAPLRVRVLPGRHTVEAADSAGRFRRVGWVDVAGEAARLEIAPVEVSRRVTEGEGDVAARRKQLRAGIDRARLERCIRRITKAGISVTAVQVELSVDATGAIRVLNVDTDLPSTTATCLREVLADVKFGAGAAASWRDRVDL